MPTPDQIPVLNGSPVAVAPDVRDLEFTRDNGALLALGKVFPITKDPRLATNLTLGKQLSPEFYILLVKDFGSLRMPPFAAFLIFGALLAAHLAGLSRAEKRKLSPVV
jgi:hypothetical protein